MTFSQVTRALCFVFLPGTRILTAAEAPQKSLPLPGEVFLIQDRTAFVILPDAKVAKKPQP